MTKPRIAALSADLENAQTEIDKLENINEDILSSFEFVKKQKIELLKKISLQDGIIDRLQQRHVKDAEIKHAYNNSLVRLENQADDYYNKYRKADNQSAFRALLICLLGAPYVVIGLYWLIKHLYISIIQH